MYYRLSARLIAIICLLSFVFPLTAQETSDPEESKPIILYSGTPRQYEIGGIDVSGISNYEDYVLIGLSGLSVGQTITVPGDEITQAIKRYWRHGLFSNVSITASKIEGNKIYLNIALTQRPRISEINYYGIKKSEREDLEARLGLVKGNQVTPNLIDRAQILIKRYFDDKGFKNAEVTIVQKDDISNDNQVIVDIEIDKKEKVKVHQITIEGNYALNEKKIKRAMKKTNEKGKLANIFRTKKFINERYEEDKQNIIDKYNELGYRDARIVTDSVAPYSENTVDVYLKIEEGDKYYLRDVTWVGNTVYPSDQLDYFLRMKKGDVYNQKLLNERLVSDQDAIGNLYYNQGYVFFGLDPVEVNIDNDSIDLEMRVVEGPQATINRVRISGNDRLYEDVIRRELRTRPGDLFSRIDLERSYREIAQMGHFNPENIQPDVQPDGTNGTVDIHWVLESKANDQIEFSAGWGQTGVIGKLSLKFTNFSLKNLFTKSDNYRGILPQGDGQTLTLSAQTNARYYQAYSLSFFDPWFGGKRPNSFSLTGYYSVQTSVSDRYYNNSYYNALSYGGYGSYGNNYYNDYSSYYDPDKYVRMFGISAGWGKRLRWPDDYFSLSGELSYQRYHLKEWYYFPVHNGKSNNLSINLTFARSSIDSPYFPRNGSEFALSAQITPPYSLLDGKDYSKYDLSNQDDVDKMHKWVEYHKWKFKSKVFIPFLSIPKTPVIMGRFDLGLLGHYNKYKRSPFETFEVGGDGMTGYSYGYATETIGLRGYDNGSLSYFSSSTGYSYTSAYAYTRMGVELRYPLMLDSTTIYVLGFAEAGNAWEQVKDFNPFDLKRSAGFGVRIFLPMVGLMGIDWAYGFDKVRGSTTYGGSHFHFILGQEF